MTTIYVVEYEDVYEDHVLQVGMTLSEEEAIKEMNGCVQRCKEYGYDNRHYRVHPYKLSEFSFTDFDD